MSGAGPGLSVVVRLSVVMTRRRLVFVGMHRQPQPGDADEQRDGDEH